MWRKNVCSAPLNDCCNLSTEPNRGKDAIISTGYLPSQRCYNKYKLSAFSSSMKVLLLYAWAEVGKPILSHFCGLAHARFKSCFSASVYAGLWSLRRQWLWLQYKGTYHLFQLSLHAGYLRYSSWWHSWSTQQLALDSSAWLSQRWCLWSCLGVGRIPCHGFVHGKKAKIPAKEVF